MMGNGLPLTARPGEVARGSPFLLAVAAIALLLFVLGVNGLILASLGRTPDVVRLGQALVLAGAAEIVAGLVLKRATGGVSLALTGSLTLLTGLALASQGDPEVRRFSLLLLGRMPAYSIITLWLLVRGVVQLAYCVVHRGSGIALWATAVGTAALFAVLIAKVPVISLVVAILGYSRDVLPFLTIVVAVAVLLAAGQLASLSRPPSPGAATSGPRLTPDL
ncbi:hypothetical protein [Sphingosinicella sp. CPCC 101087]|uniref:hypothetical protein n=1 Tax=Sphingosinicella sp. CPCC 101087 TaxID=2497754 RepID=UPI00101BA8C1|nr:hypothetical protein [Sphingosinicella sp. CPCC 101087]